jgi:hypothetical protein
MKPVLSILLYRIDVEFVPAENAVLNNGIDDFRPDDCVSSLYVAGNSMVEINKKIIKFIESSSDSYLFTSEPYVVSSIDDYSMDGFVIRLRGEEQYLWAGNVVFGWII